MQPSTQDFELYDFSVHSTVQKQLFPEQEMRFSLMVTGPAYGTQQASSALQFAQALLAAGHQLTSVFFYREGVYNANQFTFPALDEFDLVRAWQLMRVQHGVELHICIAAALRRGVVDATEAIRLELAGFNLEDGFLLSGLSTLAQSAVSCDRMVQF